MAYIKKIEPNSVDSHQTSPAYMLTFVRWSNRDTSHFGDKQSNSANELKKTVTKQKYLDTSVPLVVISDCIQVTVSSAKNSFTHQANMLLMGGDINYSTAIAPGDFVLINLVNNDQALFGKNNDPHTADNDSLYYRATKSFSAINKADDGFKGIFKVQSVRRVLQVAPNGIKTFHYQIVAVAFTEFNQVVYFNPYLFDNPKELETAGRLLTAAASIEWANNLNKDLNNLSKIFKSFVGFLIGEGFPRDIMSQKSNEVVRNHNQNFYIPSEVAALLGISASTAGIRAADIFNYYVGIEKYTNSGENDHLGLNPKMVTRNGMFYSTGPELSGVALIQAEPWNQVTAWSILNQYSNSLINEMYTSFKLLPNNKVMPCVVFRQKPFTSKLFQKNNLNIETTAFLDLPRWRISPHLITSLSLGRDEAARINFVHIVGKTRYLNLKDANVQQAASKLHQQDSDDIKRNGLRPFINSCDFDYPIDSNKITKAGIWNKLMFDWLNNGHLKENGTLVCAGLTENIAVGDNVQIENIVLHIESITHVMQINADGMKHFETTLKLSYGVDVRTDQNNNQLYPEMTYVSAAEYRQNEYNEDKILPGFSDSQDVATRTDAEKNIKSNKEKPYSDPITTNIKKDKES